MSVGIGQHRRGAGPDRPDPGRRSPAPAIAATGRRRRLGHRRPASTVHGRRPARPASPARLAGAAAGPPRPASATAGRRGTVTGGADRRLGREVPRRALRLRRHHLGRHRLLRPGPARLRRPRHLAAPDRGRPGPRRHRGAQPGPGPARRHPGLRRPGLPRRHLPRQQHDDRRPGAGREGQDPERLRDPGQHPPGRRRRRPPARRGRVRPVAAWPAGQRWPASASTPAIVRPERGAVPAAERPAGRGRRRPSPAATPRRSARPARRA